MIPCVGCGRLYGHLDTCEVKRLHEQLDRCITDYGVSHVRIALQLGPELNEYQRRRQVP